VTLQRYVLAEGDRSKFFIYLDPPYFVKGSRLYLNYYAPKDHAVLASFLRRIRRVRWLVTYDNAAEICALYKWCKVIPFSLHYSAYDSREGSEVVICNRELKLPGTQVLEDVG
jgi:DNA adenine methylase